MSLGSIFKGWKSLCGVASYKKRVGCAFTNYYIVMAVRVVISVPTKKFMSFAVSLFYWQGSNIFWRDQCQTDMSCLWMKRAMRVFCNPPSSNWSRQKNVAHHFKQGILQGLFLCLFLIYYLYFCQKWQMWCGVFFKLRFCVNDFCLLIF